MRQINPVAFAWAECERRLHKKALADAFKRKRQKEIDSWSSEVHTVMELLGGEPTGLIIEILGSSVLERNANSLTIYLQQIGNWDSFGGKPKPMLRELVTSNKFKNLLYNEKKNDNKRQKSRRII